jgi:hypothetical protein
MAAKINLRTGWHHSEESKKKMSLAKIGKVIFTENKRRTAIENIAKGRAMRTAETFKKISLANKGRIPSIEERLKRSLALKGKPAWNKGLTKDNNEIMSKISKKLKGINLSEETRLKISLSLKGKIPKNLSLLNANKNGSGNPMWRGGTSYMPYDTRWGRSFRRFIRERDNQTCMNCGIHREELKVSLSVHHIDYNKQNTIKENCISLCPTCHIRTQRDRSHWTKIFQEKLIKLYDYKYMVDKL